MRGWNIWDLLFQLLCESCSSTPLGFVLRAGIFLSPFQIVAWWFFDLGMPLAVQPKCSPVAEAVLKIPWFFWQITVMVHKASVAGCQIVTLIFFFFFQKHIFTYRYIFKIESCLVSLVNEMQACSHLSRDFWCTWSSDYGRLWHECLGNQSNAQST